MRLGGSMARQVRFGMDVGIPGEGCVGHKFFLKLF